MFVVSIAKVDIELCFMRAQAHFWNNERDRSADLRLMNNFCDNLCIRSSLRPDTGSDFRAFFVKYSVLYNRRLAICSRKLIVGSRVEYDSSSCKDTFTIVAIAADQMLKLSNGAIAHPLWIKCI
jgi:hypothetical protein